MMRRVFAIGALCVTLFTFSGCDWMPGKPTPSERWKSPSEITSFNVLYSENCAACHSNNPDQISPVLPLNDPLYLSILPQATMREIIANGIHGTSMPAFAVSSGGMLTDQQVDILVSGIYPAKPATPPAGEKLPPYTAPLGNITSGAQTYQVYCASCHGADGKGGEKAGSIVNPSYLGLVSDQYLRSVVIAGRMDLGMPNYKNYVDGKPMSDPEIADVVAWMASHRLPAGASAIPSPSPLVTP